MKNMWKRAVHWLRAEGWGRVMVQVAVIFGCEHGEEIQT